MRRRDGAGVNTFGRVVWCAELHRGKSEQIAQHNTEAKRKKNECRIKRAHMVVVDVVRQNDQDEDEDAACVSELAPLG